jgi:enoyl-[acyl-carrier-protein] reductase (NADH)
MAREISSVRKDAKVLGIGAVDVRNVESLEKAVKTCREELGGIDFVMYAALSMLKKLKTFLIINQRRSRGEFSSANNTIKFQRLQNSNGY